MKKNIVIVVSAMNMGGAQRVVSILSDRWVRDGHIVTLIITFSDEIENHYHINADVNVKHLVNNKLFPRFKPLNLISKLLNLRKLIKAVNADVVISFLARVNVATTLSTIGLSPSLVVCERTWPPFASLNHNYFWLSRMLLKRADHFIVQTEKSQSWLKEHFSTSNVTAIPNPVSYPLLSENHSLVFPSSVLLTKHKVVLASGRMHEIKQFDMLIKAFARINDKYKEWVLVILGDGEERDYLNNIIKELGVGDQVFFPGRVGNIGDWYSRADLFVLSSKVEGFPNVLLEAMAHGVASISFDCDTGPRDMIQHGVNGVLVDPEEQEAGLTRAMESMMSDEGLRSIMAKNSVRVRDKFSIERISKTWDQILDL
jgi:GalNAc-alpha-(1->4)-GalNAc-alpha-(1->3)-diNAcBac-PP-undecaprenol alpha-1,4-N-acetyl-D-galactosaminyltransferase